MEFFFICRMHIYLHLQLDLNNIPITINNILHKQTLASNRTCINTSVGPRLSSLLKSDYFFFFFMLQAEFKVAANRSAILSMSASRSYFSFTLRAAGTALSSFFCSDKGPGTASSPITFSFTGGGENTKSLFPNSILNSSSDTSISGQRRISGVPMALPSLLFASAETWRWSFVVLHQFSSVRAVPMWLIMQLQLLLFGLL